VTGCGKGAERPPGVAKSRATVPSRCPRTGQKPEAESRGRMGAERKAVNIIFEADMVMVVTWRVVDWYWLSLAVKPTPLRKKWPC
jgi:hypothetical protein